MHTISTVTGYDTIITTVTGYDTFYHVNWIFLDQSLMRSNKCDVQDLEIPYFFGYKMEFFSFQNNPKDLDPSCNPKDLDPSCKTDLDLWDCLGRVNLVL